MYFISPFYYFKFLVSALKFFYLAIREMVLERARKEGLEKGLKKGREEGKAEVVRNLITKIGLTDAQAADIAEVPKDFVKKVRRRLNK